MRKVLSLILSALMLLTVFTAGCGKGTVLVEGETYSNQIGVYSELEKTETTAVYNKDLFYRNEKILSGADPAVLYCEDVTDTENYGKYFLFGTMAFGVYNCYESTDLVSWKNCTAAYLYDPSAWEFANTFAPEFLWEKDADRAKYGLDVDAPGEGVYFMFYSARIGATTTVLHNGNGVFGLETNYLGLGVSTSPCGPYQSWSGVEKGAIIDGVNYGTAEGFAKYTIYAEQAENGDLSDYAKDNYIARNGDVVDVDDYWWNPAAARAALEFQWNHKAEAGTIVNGTYIPEAAKNAEYNGGARDFTCIDPTPFIDPVTGDKYVFLARVNTGMTDIMINGEPLFARNSIYAVKCLDNDWAQLDYSTITRITRNRYSFATAGDAVDYNEAANSFDASKFTKGVKEDVINNPYTQGINTAEAHISAGPTAGLNEGPQVSYNAESGLYYLTFSTGTYVDNTYSVMTAVAYSPMGPYRKLELYEGGLMLTTNHGMASDLVTGPGHHQMLKVGNEDFVVYHRHLNINYSQSNRGGVIDRLVWIANDYGMLVPKTNGPTTNLQPKIYGTGSTKYDIISYDASIEVDGDDYNDAKYLNDGVIVIHNDLVEPHVKQFEFMDKSVTITLTFDDYRDITAIMVYNSYDYETVFEKIKLIEMDAKVDGKKGKVVIEDLLFGWDMGEQSFDGQMRAGSAAVAAFNEISVKEISITVENYNYGDDYSGITAISEIYVLGKPIK